MSVNNTYCKVKGADISAFTNEIFETGTAFDEIKEDSFIASLKQDYLAFLMDEKGNVLITTLNKGELDGSISLYIAPAEAVSNGE